MEVIYNGQNQKRRAFRTWWSGKDQSGGSNGIFIRHDNPYGKDF